MPGFSNAFQNSMHSSGADLTQQDQEVVSMTVMAHNSRRICTDIVHQNDQDIVGHIYEGLPCFGERDDISTSAAPGMVRVYSLPEFNRMLYRARSGHHASRNVYNAAAIMSNYSYLGMNSTVGEANQDKSYHIPARVISQEMHGSTERLSDIFSPSYEWFNDTAEDAVQHDVGYPRPMAHATDCVQSTTSLYLVLMPVSFDFAHGFTANPFPLLRDLHRFASYHANNVDRDAERPSIYFDGGDSFETWEDTPFSTLFYDGDAPADADEGNNGDEFEQPRPAIRVRREDADSDRNRFGGVTYSVVPFASNSPSPPSPKDFMVCSLPGAPEARVFRVGSYAVDQKFFIGTHHQERDRVFASSRAVHDAVIKPGNSHEYHYQRLPSMAATLGTCGH